MTEQGRDRAVLLALTLVSAAVLFPLRPYGLQMGNEGWLLHPTLRMLDGEVLYRDVLTYYAPLPYHLLGWVFELFGRSFLVSRTLSLMLLVATAALAYRVGRRLVPMWIAWCPALLYVLAPGPWFKVNYAFCSMLFFLALARALERPGPRRCAWMGAACGLTLIARHELGVAQLGIAVVAAALPTLASVRFGGHATTWGIATWRAAARDVIVTLASVATVVLPIVLYYASQDALGMMWQMMFVKGFSQMPDWITPLKGLVTPATFAEAREGRGAGVFLVAPVFVYPAVGVVLLVRLALEGLVARNVLTGALLAYGVATMPQAYSMPFVIRLLQSALPLYLLSGYLVVEVGRAIGSLFGKPEWAPVRVAGASVTILAAAWVAWLVNVGIANVVPGDEFTGAWRMRRQAEPVPILGGDTVYLPWARAEEVRLVREFLDSHAAPGEPYLALPLLASYYLMIERLNPTGLLGERPRAHDSVVTQARKEREMQRLLDSPGRYAIVTRSWYAMPDPPEHMRAVLRREFHPVRRYGSVFILERGMDEPARLLTDVALRLEVGIVDPRDADILRGLALERPEWPLVQEFRVPFLLRQGDAAGALAALRKAHDLDPRAATGLETAAGILLGTGRTIEARDTLREVHAVRVSPHSQTLWERLPDSLRR